MAGLLKFSSFALKNLFSKPATRNYPDLPPKSTSATRGSVQVDVEQCVFCGLCMRRCPSEAIKVDRTAKTWSIERMGCVQCADCVSVCPKKCLSMNAKYTPPSSVKTVDVFRKAEPAVTPAEMVSVKKADTALQMNMDNCVLCGLCVKQCPVGALKVDRAAQTWSIAREECLLCGACAQRCPKKCLSLSERTEETLPSVYTKKPIGEATPAASSAAAPQPSAHSSALLMNLENCVFCGLCAKQCTENAIKIDRTAKTWSVDREACLLCGACVQRCPKKSLRIDEMPDSEIPSVYTKHPTAVSSAPETDTAPTAKPSEGSSAVLIGIENCVLCGMCVKQCPVEAIQVDRASKTWRIDRSICLLCGACVQRCPKKCLGIGQASNLTMQSSVYTKS